ncbi:MAG: DUF899 family protein [Chitinophagaceae bacterium]|nr:DUF899 family protein [Rubrivivax sp.]
MSIVHAQASSLDRHPLATRNEWIAARMSLLAREKELTRLRDRVASERRALPWVRLEKNHVFDTLTGPRRLSELFEARRQLLVQHFMFGPGWEQGCKSCSFMADHLDGMSAHLAQRDIALLVVSRAPLAEIERPRLFRLRTCIHSTQASSISNRSKALKSPARRGRSRRRGVLN